jgi:hypothetical protein
MDKFINTGLHSGSELDALLACCDARAKNEGYTAWNDPKLSSPLKKAIILKCIEVSEFPIVLL